MHQHIFKIIVLPLALVCFALSPMAQAILPAPDGGYSGNNTAEGTNALYRLTTGVWNSAFGFGALYKNALGIRNTAVGYQALFNNNAAVGSASSTGRDNVAIGANAAYYNTTGNGNIAIGSFALYGNTTGSNNIIIGNHAATQGNLSGTTIVGDSFSSGPTYVSIGRAPTFLRGNLLVQGVLSAVVNAVNDVYIGQQYNEQGFPDYKTLRVHLIAQDAVFMDAVYGNPITGSPVNIASNGQLGVAPSSERFKAEIKPMDNASEMIFSLKPVTFHYKKQVDPKGIPQFGLVAEEVEKVNPDLITRDGDGKPYTVRYDAVNAMLLNEFLKEHQTVQELKSATAKQEATIAKQQKQIEALTVGLQNVSAQVQLKTATPQTVANNQ